MMDGLEGMMDGLTGMMDGLAGVMDGLEGVKDGLEVVIRGPWFIDVEPRGLVERHKLMKADIMRLN